MNKKVEFKIALHAPNLINICVDEHKDGDLSGRMYHCFTEEGWKFNNMMHLIDSMEKLFDSICYPQASTQQRKFVDCKISSSAELKKVTEQKDIVQNRGKKGTFLVHVQYRQNSSWQGQVEWVEKEILKNFNSELDLMKLITGALEE